MTRRAARARLSDPVNRWCRGAGQYAGIDEVGQRHAALRSRSRAFASVSRTLATRRFRAGAARRSPSLTVSFNVLVPSSALAAARAFSSMSTRRFAMRANISRRLIVYLRAGVLAISVDPALDHEGRGPDAPALAAEARKRASIACEDRRTSPGSGRTVPGRTEPGEVRRSSQAMEAGLRAPAASANASGPRPSWSRAGPVVTLVIYL